MNYYVDIIDTENNEHVTQIENAQESAIRLKHSGSDEKDGLVIVGSSLFFNMNVPQHENADAVFIDLFTGDEQRFKVELRRETDDLLIWQGFLLPDSYSEPWKQGTFFVSFTATDGLGRLKGKYLPDNFYKDEIDVATIIATCLQLTGLQMPIYMSLGVENYFVKEWHSIYINTEYFINNKKKEDAYKILKTLLNDTVSCVFQELGYWHVEGLNKRNLKVYTTAHYTYEGVYVEDVERTRNIKEIPGNIAAYPDVTIVPPYSKIEVTHERKEVSFPATIANEQDEDWVLLTGVVGQIHATDWQNHDGCYAKAIEPDYIVAIPSTYAHVGGDTAYPFDPDKYISLRRKIYLKPSHKYRLKFEIYVNQRGGAWEPDNYYYNNIWPAHCRYDVIFNEEILFSSWQGEVSDEEKFHFDSRDSEVTLEFIADVGGLLDLKWYAPFATPQNLGFRYLEFKNIEIKEIGFEETHTSISEISEDYTIEKDYEVTFADDASAFSKCFQLAKLKEQTEFYTEILVPILYTFSQNGNNYAVVQLDGANLISDNINSTYYYTDPLENVEVIYNYANGEQMVVKTDFALPFASNFKVRIYNIDDYTVSRQYWEKWTDAVYAIEQERYTQAVANVLRRMFTVPHPKVDISVKMPVAFTDIIKWHYIEPSNYFIINKEWNLDNGETKLTINKAVYQTDTTTNPGENIPPIVEAGETIYITNSQTTASLDAEAYDPDGFITSYSWIKTVGGGSPVIETPSEEDTNLSALTDDFYTFQITVADNDGATASDTVNVVRVLDHTITLNQIYAASGTIPGVGHGEYVEKHYRFTVTPDLPDGTNINITSTLFLNRILQDGDEDYLLHFELIKNSATILEYEYDQPNQFGHTTIENFNYNNTDTIDLKMRVEASLGTPEAEYAEATINFLIENDGITFTTGLGNILGLPEEVEVYADTIS